MKKIRERDALAKPIIKPDKKLSGKPFIAENLVKMIVFFMIALSVVAANFFLESRVFSAPEKNDELFSSFDYKKTNIVPENAVLRFSEEEGVVNSLEVLSQKPYIFIMDSGKFWGNFMISPEKFNFVADRIVIIPKYAVFNLEFDRNKLNLSVYDGDVYIGFLSEDHAVSEYLDEYSSVFVNRLLVPRGTQISIPLVKLDDRLSRLLTTKLVKEFKFAFIPLAERQSDRVLKNINLDRKFRQEIKQKASAELLNKGGFSRSEMIEGIFNLQKSFTFVPEKRRKIVFNHLFSYLDQALFEATRGEKEAAINMTEIFFDRLRSLPQEFIEKSEFWNEFDRYINRLTVFSPDDLQYEVLTILLEKKFFFKRDLFETVNYLWSNVYRSLEINSVAAEKALDVYYKHLDQSFGNVPDRGFYDYHLTYQNELFDNLLLQNAIFYKEGYFSMKAVIEDKLLELYQEGPLKNELKQSMISVKIDFLKRLMKFFFDGDVDLNQAKRITEYLIKEVKHLMPANSSEIAVTELFESQIKEISNFWGYLKSPEYHSSKTYGLNHRERYQSYLDETNKIWNFINVQEDIFGESKKGVKTLEEIKEEIIDVFKSAGGYQNLQISDLTRVDQRFVKVQAVLEGYLLEAVFDRDKELLKEVYVYDQLVAEQSVRLMDVLSLIRDKFADLGSDAFKPEENYNEETFAQRVARLFIAKKMKEYGFSAELENVSVVDELNALYRVEQIYLEEKKNVILTFDFLMNGEFATNLFMVIDGKPANIPGKYTLEEVHSIALAEGIFSSGVRR